MVQFQEQKFLIGLILMVPVYALESVIFFVNLLSSLMQFIINICFMICNVYLDSKGDRLYLG